MTQLTKFLSLGFFAVIVWVKLIGITDPDTLWYKCLVVPLPFWGIVVFGAISAAIVLYRTLTFNDCPEAAKELLEQIEEARKDLRKRGMKSL
ncbi:Dolichol-phosphate mannosyltransferase subunit 3 [Orchesella cincta]|uniref:Dolichol-phosphate mannosyltransferase subunit 3 n=1 Tax=Orchesella cincta TaxID=48709 RepID=A0A1D2NJG7_ORCCI|nr:Dolichol-phosphate mannosyltransferase subunit 3 [Orchesella cincta]